MTEKLIKIDGEVYKQTTTEEKVDLEELEEHKANLQKRIDDIKKLK